MRRDRASVVLEQRAWLAGISEEKRGNPIGGVMVALARLEELVSAAIEVMGRSLALSSSSAPEESR